MKATIGVIFVLGTCALLSGNMAYAQTGEQRHIFTVTKFHATMPAGGSAAERDSIFGIFTDLTKMNSKYVSQKALRHSWGHNSQDWVMITECANWDDIESSGKIDEENFKKKWPKGDMESVSRTFDKYSPPTPTKSTRSYRSTQSSCYELVIRPTAR